MSNRDVMKALRDELKCAAFELDDADGRIGFANFCGTHGGVAVIVNTAARDQAADTIWGDPGPDTERTGAATRRAIGDQPAA
jgi:hypothetical protein